MKKFLISILFMFLAMPVFSEPIENATSQIDDLAKPIEIGVTFDWISKNQIQRDENIAQIQSTLFNYNTVSKYSKKEFKEKNAEQNKDVMTDKGEPASVNQAKTTPTSKDGTPPIQSETVEAGKNAPK